MNIVIYSPSWPAQSSSNGITTYCSHIIPSLRALGHDVTVITSEIYDNTDDTSLVELKYNTNVAIRAFLRLIDRVNQGYRQYYLVSRALVQTLESIDKIKKIDIFEIEESFGWHRYIQHKATFPVVMRLHGPHYINGVMTGKELTPSDENRIQREKNAFLQAKYVSAPCEWVLNDVKSSVNVKWNLSLVAHNPIPSIPISMRWHKKKINQQQILFVGRFDRHKGGDVVIDAFNEILKQHPNATLLFAGPDRGIFINGEEFDVHAYARKTLLNRNIHKFKYLGQVNHDQLATLRAESHATIIASRNENFPYTGLEALAFNSPIVASNAGGISELFENEISGLYFESGNAVDLALKVCRLLIDTQFAEKLSRNAQLRCSAIFSIDTVTRETLNFYNEVIRSYEKL